MTRTSAVPATALLLLACSGASHGEASRAYVTVVVSGSERVGAGVRASLARGVAGLPVDVRIASLPTRTAGTAQRDDATARLASARHDYVYGEFARCIATLGDAAWTTALLTEGRRDVAARVLFWRGACRSAADDPAGARREADAFAVYGFDVPADAATTVSPSVEDVFARAQAAASSAARIAVRITSRTEARLAVSLDGRAAACATPCVTDLAPGDHVVAFASDGFVPESRVVHVEPGAAVVADPSPAPPALAATQWLARYATGLALDSDASLRLLGTATRARQLVLVLADAHAGTTTLRGALAVEGIVRARAERSMAERDLSAQAGSLLRELLVRGRVVAPEPPLTARPAFWLAMGGTALVAAGAVVVALYPRPVDLMLRWSP